MSDPTEEKDRVKAQGPGVYVTKFGILPTTCIVEQVDDSKQPHMLTFLTEKQDKSHQVYSPKNRISKKCTRCENALVPNRNPKESF